MVGNGNNDSLTDGKCRNSELEIDSVVGDINSSAFSKNYGIFKGIKINSIKGSIRSNAFYGQPLIGEITLGDTEAVNNNNIIETNAFHDCTKLQKVIILGGYSSIGNNCFDGCINLVNVDLGNSITSLGEAIFSNCYKLVALNLPDSLTSFTRRTFNNAFIESLQLGASIMTLPDYAFNNLRNLKYVTLNDNLITLSKYCFANTNITSIILPENVIDIPEGAFSHSSIQSITSMGNIVSIGDHAFEYCINLQEFDISHITTLGVQVFRNSNFNITIPMSLTSYKSNSFAEIGGNINIEPGFMLNLNMSLTLSNFNDDNILAFLKSLPDMTEASKYTVTISPTKTRVINDNKYDYYSTIKDKRINTQGEELTWDEESGNMTVDEYVMSKNITLT